MLKKRWDMDFAGILATKDEVYRYNIIVNKQGSLQFYLKLISAFSINEKLVTAFAEDIDYPDNYAESNEVRISKMEAFLEKYIFFFNIEVTSNGSEDFYRAKNITYVKKNDEFKREDVLNQIPIFTGDSEELNQKIFETKLQSNKFIGDNKSISNDEDDTPTIICWKEQNTDSTLGDSLYLYGLFDSHDYAHGGFRFKINNNELKVTEFPLANESYNYYENRDVLYLPLEKYQEVERRLLEAENKLLIEDKTKAEFTPENESNDKKISFEEEFIKAFQNRCASQELFYDEKDLYNFHTAMKTGSLVILAGMSGTGKSKLVQCYAEAMDLKKEQLLFIPVRPYWQDDADVLGYLDVMNNVYRPGDSGLVNLLQHAYTNQEQMHIVCFDEMNIARVEHYFSQFLSVLEMDENKRSLRLYNDDMQFKIYNNTQYDPIIKIGNNILFVGTVNLDESTYQFSDKVLDRANVINLNVLPYYEQIASLANKNLNESQEIKVDMSVVKYNQFRNKESRNLLEHEAKCLWEIHLELQAVDRNLGIGWRIVKQMGTYLSNLPENAILNRQEAFDLQLVQRVLTKIRGSEEQFIKLIGRYDQESDEVVDSKLMRILSELKDYPLIETKKVIVSKAKELKLHGYSL